VTCVVQVGGKVRDRLQVAPSIGDDELRSLALASELVQRALDGRGVRTVVCVRRSSSTWCPLEPLSRHGRQMSVAVVTDSTAYLRAR
jgi:hypothetical protein